MVVKLLPDSTIPCPYLPNRSFTSEHFFAADLKETELDLLLARGYRHFGNYFFRPFCNICHACIPLRVVTNKAKISKRGRRVLNRNKKFHLEITDGRECTEEMYHLYRLHKKRFITRRDEEAEATEGSYRLFKESFECDMPHSRQYRLYEENSLIGVCHFDETGKSLSAIYSYYNDSYKRESIGTFFIVSLIKRGMNQHIAYCYLGYYIEENRHMRYKGDFIPNEVLLDEKGWRTFRETNEAREVVLRRPLEFTPVLRVSDFI